MTKNNQTETHDVRRQTHERDWKNQFATTRRSALVKPIRIDIHNEKKKVENAKRNMYKKFSSDNADITYKFLDRLRLENKSYGRIANYGDCIRRILEIKDDKKIQDWSRQEIEHIHKVLADSDYENSVKKDTLSALKWLV